MLIQIRLIAALLVITLGLPVNASMEDSDAIKTPANPSNISSLLNTPEGDKWEIVDNLANAPSQVVPSRVIMDTTFVNRDLSFLVARIKMLESYKVNENSDHLKQCLWIYAVGNNDNLQTYLSQQTVVVRNKDKSKEILNKNNDQIPIILSALKNCHLISEAVCKEIEKKFAHKDPSSTRDLSESFKEALKEDGWNYFNELDRPQKSITHDNVIQRTFDFTLDKEFKEVQILKIKLGIYPNDIHTLTVLTIGENDELTSELMKKDILYKIADKSYSIITREYKNKTNDQIPFMLDVLKGMKLIPELLGAEIIKRLMK